MSTSIPTTQSAWVARNAGKPQDVLKLEEEYPVPVPSKDQLLVKVHASSLNPVGWKAISIAPLSLLHKKPAVLESDFSGVLVGGNVDGTGLTIGQAVFGIIPADVAQRSGNGTLAEYTVVDRGLVVPKPFNVTHAEASTFPLAGLTAYAALVQSGGLKQGDGKRVFINGGSGGVGAWAVQIAKAFGAFVVTTCSPESKDLVSSFGPDHTIDYRAVQPSLSAHLANTYPISSSRGFDIFLDTVGTPELYYACADYLKEDGIYVDVAGSIHMKGALDMFCTAIGVVSRSVRPTWLGGLGRKYIFLLVRIQTMRTELKHAAVLIAEGKLKPPVDHVYSFSNVLQAYDRQMSGRAKGKVVVSVADE